MGTGPFFFGVLEDAATLEFKVLYKFKKLLMVFVSLFWKASNESGPYGKVGDSIAHSLQKSTNVFPIGFPVHLIKHVI
jgi:hypothetical protein